ncbi:MAG TPA: hypothetical protein VGP80_14210 [Gemmatimonadales bacterium]|jgi:hypothetical protein|nr:hypothetical protein [Gemmatimonadales bacterium]
MRINFAGPVAVACLLACSNSTELNQLPKPFTHATAMGDCAPWDGAAVSILLTTGPVDSAAQPSPPFLRLAIWKSRASLGSGVFAWPSDEQVGAASYCVTGESCEAADTGRVQFRDTGSDSMVVGEFQLSFKNQGPVAGGFRAVWLEHRVLCG